MALRLLKESTIFRSESDTYICYLNSELIIEVIDVVVEEFCPSACLLGGTERIDTDFTTHPKKFLSKNRIFIDFLLMFDCEFLQILFEFFKLSFHLI
jgi:hypothetical protein